MMSVFVSPVIAAITVGVGVPLMLTYVYGVVPMSLCRNGWCRPQTEPPEVRNIQLEDLANFSDHWTGQPNPALTEGSVQEVSVNVEEVMPPPSTSVVQPVAKGSVELPNDGHNDSTEQIVQSDGADVAEECAFSSTQTFALREGTNIEVRVEIEAQPRGGRKPSLSSILSSKSLSAESLSQPCEPLCASQQPGSTDPVPVPEIDSV
ncbi:E3 ubiquitin-protein ligase RNF19B-like isoform X2 [Pimephales promelas]|uniref:E3 ubiquitin-protein ligase RNF19B-like isoform X2 n=1 Tax=Pimephales promelas TaxID=90988 RepID=UPI0019557D63|nr:E3 ubiquitin-protein ligase RNF19B-like isoform X2 [Pimephales promelas]